METLNMPKPQFFLTTLLVAIVAVSAAMADEKADAAVRARVVAPFIDEETLAVVHVDLSRVAIDPLFDTLAQVVPQAAEERKEAKAGLGGALSGLTKLGIRDFYMLFPMSFVPPQPPLDLLVVKPGTDAEAVRAAIPGFRGTAKLIGNIVALADREEALARLGNLKTDDRPELVKAFQAAGDTAVQVAVLPPRHFARVVEEMLPELPKQIGGGPSTIITRGALWAALGIDLPPKAKARLVIQSQDPAAAEALIQKFGDTLRFLGGLPETKNFVPRFGEIATNLIPKAEKDQLVLVLEEAGVKGVLELLRTPFGKSPIGGKAQSIHKQPQAACSGDAQLLRCVKIVPARRQVRQGRQAASELARADPAVYRAGQSVQAVSSR